MSGALVDVDATLNTLDSGPRRSPHRRIRLPTARLSPRPTSRRRGQVVAHSLWHSHSRAGGHESFQEVDKARLRVVGRTACHQ
jgi:hypothetical protein